jgi:hypothetical protein
MWKQSAVVASLNGADDVRNRVVFHASNLMRNADNRLDQYSIAWRVPRPSRSLILCSHGVAPFVPVHHALLKFGGCVGDDLQKLAHWVSPVCLFFSVAFLAPFAFAKNPVALHALACVLFEFRVGHSDPFGESRPIKVFCVSVLPLLVVNVAIMKPRRIPVDLFVRQARATRSGKECFALGIVGKDVQQTIVEPVAQ